MRRMLLPLLCVPVLVGLAAADPAPDAAAIAVVAKAIKAHGGEEALIKYKASQASSKGKITLPGVGEVEFAQEVASMLPDKIKETLHLDIGGKQITIVTLMNGDAVAIEAAGKDIPITDEVKKAMKDAQYMMRVGRLWPLVKDKGYELSVIGENKVEGKPAVGVLVKSKDHKDISLYFDKETGLLAKIEHRTADPMTGKEVAEERIVVSYGAKSKEGILLPKEILIKHDGETFMKIEMTEATVLESLDDSTFKK